MLWTVLRSVRREVPPPCPEDPPCVERVRSVPKRGCPASNGNVPRRRRRPMANARPSQRDLYERFKALHERDCAFVMPNPLDGLSALLCNDAGFPAIATSSAALAFSLGREDGLHA